MYLYDEVDQQIVDERVAQFADQTRRFLAQTLTDEEFRPLRLQNGLYIQRHAPMLRVAIPYGMLASHQLRTLSHIADKWDRGYGHFSTRQNIQFNWPKLEDVPDILAELAKVQMHCIQTSGNCIRNTTTDHFAGIAPDEVVNPLLWCELIRQWSTLHPEFAFLPRKFKIAVSGATHDRAAVGVHDIGLQATTRDGETGFTVWVGGGLGRTPMVGKQIREFLPWHDLLTYLQAILRVYNLHGRRDNKYKARIKILVKELTPAAFAAEVETEWARIKDGPNRLTNADVQRIEGQFTWPEYDTQLLSQDDPTDQHMVEDPAFSRWVKRCVHGHRVPGYCAVSLSLKATGVPPGDITSAQMTAVADISDQYGFGEVRVSHEQNLILADVPRHRLYELWKDLKALELASPNIGMLTNIIACPGGDFCSLANAVSIPVARAIQERFDNLDYLYEIGELDLNISGCINACGHHHVGHIGILGVDKAGEEWYQVTIGGRQSSGPEKLPSPDVGGSEHDRTLRANLPGAPGAGGAAIGKIIGPSFARDEIPDVVEKLVQTYLRERDSEAEKFVDVVARLGLDPFKLGVYGEPDRAPHKEAAPA